MLLQPTKATPLINGLLLDGCKILNVPNMALVCSRQFNLAAATALEWVCRFTSNFSLPGSLYVPPKDDAFNECKSKALKGMKVKHAVSVIATVFSA